MLFVDEDSVEDVEEDSEEELDEADSDLPVFPLPAFWPEFVPEELSVLDSLVFPSESPLLGSLNLSE